MRVMDKKIGIIDVFEAKKTICSWVQETPLEYHRGLSHLSGVQVFLKLELMRETRAFKIRGAFNALTHLSMKQKGNGIIAASGGSHALGVAYAGNKLGIKTTIVATVRAPKSIQENCKYYGAEVIVAGEVYDDAKKVAEEIAKERNLTLIHSYDDPYIIAGQGTIGLEILQQMKPDVIICPVGGGGLLAGVGLVVAAISPDTEVWGVEPETAAAMSTAINVGRLVSIEDPRSIADKLVVKQVGQLNLDIARETVSKMVTVSEKEIREAVYLLSSSANLWAEGAAGAALAAMLKEKESLAKRKVALILTGGNVEAKVMANILAEFSH